MKFSWFRRARQEPIKRPEKIYHYPWHHRSLLILPVLIGKFILIGVAFYLLTEGLTARSVLTASLPVLIAVALIAFALRELHVHFRRFPDHFYFEDGALVAVMATGKEIRVPTGQLAAVRRHRWRFVWVMPRSAYMELVAESGDRLVLAPLLEEIDKFFKTVRQFNPDCRWEVG